MTTAAASSERIQVPTAGRYRIDPEQSTVTFATRHLFGLAPVRGTFELRDGLIVVAERVTDSTVWARVSASSFRTGNDARDSTVLSKRLLDADTHHSFAFSSTALVQEQGEWLLRGELEVRGVTQLTEARIGSLAVDDAGGPLRVTAQVVIDRYAFGITAYRGLVARKLAIELNVTARRETDRPNTGRESA
jgi:polyisoprenoid-binding protein YceI